MQDFPESGALNGCPLFLAVFSFGDLPCFAAGPLTIPSPGNGSSKFPSGTGNLELFECQQFALGGDFRRIEPFVVREEEVPEHLGKLLAVIESEVVCPRVVR